MKSEINIYYYDKTTTNSQLSNYYDKTTTNSLFDNAFFNLTTPGYFKTYDRILVSGAPRCPFYSITGSTDLTISKDVTIYTYTYDINKLNISGLSNYYQKDEAQEKIINHGGRGVVLFELNGCIIPKIHLSRIVGEAPISVSKYWESSDPTKDGNVGISINLYQDNIIKYATSLSSLFKPVTGNLIYIKSFKWFIACCIY